MKRKLHRGAALLFSVGLALLLAVGAMAAESTASCSGELYEALFQNLSDQKSDFSITCTDVLRRDMEMGAYQGIPEMLRAMAANLPNTDGTGADTVMLNVNSAYMTQRDHTLEFHVEYLLDQEKLRWVSGQVDEILALLQLENDTDYMKIKKVYQYMGTHFSYDSTLTRYTDYDGLTEGNMVCQGYALLTYKLLWRAGVPCRIVVGVSSGEQHGWNIVKLGDVWYYLDTTWDAAGDAGGAMYWRYFLRSEEDFKSHKLDSRYRDSAVFRAACPMAETSYDVPSAEILVEDTPYSGLTIRNGKSIQLNYVLHPETEMPVTWASTDSTVASVDETGLLTSLTPGKVNITATPADPTYVPGVFPVVAVDLRTCSPWAEEGLNSFYLRKYYPSGLCSDYQKPITREEFALLLATMLPSVPQNNGVLRVPEFDDVEESPYWSSIVYCTARGIFQGTDLRRFSPKSVLTREQAATLLCDVLNFCKAETPEPESVELRDLDQAFGWAQPYILRAAGLGIASGKSNGCFDPKGAVTREQAAVLLERLFSAYLEPLIPEELPES